jgi:endonuclease G
MKKARKSNSKRKWLVILFLVLVIPILLFRVFNFRKPNLGGNFGSGSEMGLELPLYQKNDLVIRHSAFALCYSEEHEQPLWVAYELRADELTKRAKRQNDFRVDPSIPTGSASPDDYRSSGYDRGHLAPAADMAFSSQAMSESFLMSNMSPQNPTFNRGIWNDLEQKVRFWAKKEGSLYVVTAGVLKGNLPKIGANGVSVPQLFYKVLLDMTDQPKALAFVLANQGSKSDLSRFAVSVDSVEKLTGIDFFHLLDDELEEKLESQVQLSLWGL